MYRNTGPVCWASNVNLLYFYHSPRNSCMFNRLSTAGGVVATTAGWELELLSCAVRLPNWFSEAGLQLKAVCGTGCWQ